jgi:hypothetical protein
VPILSTAKSIPENLSKEDMDKLQEMVKKYTEREAKKLARNKDKEKYYGILIQPVYEDGYTIPRFIIEIGVKKGADMFNVIDSKRIYHCMSIEQALSEYRSTISSSFGHVILCKKDQNIKEILKTLKDIIYTNTIESLRKRVSLNKNQMKKCKLLALEDMEYPDIPTM